MKFTLNVNYLAAALKIAPKNASYAGHRSYLGGVHFDFDARTLVATDGHFLIALGAAITAADDGIDDKGRAVPGTLGNHAPFILHADAVKELVKAAKDCRVTHAEMELIAGDNLETLSFSANGGTRSWIIDNTSKYPGWRHIVPQSLALEPAQFDPELVARMADALALASRRKGGKVYTQLHTDTAKSAAVMTCADENVLGVVMPWRADTERQPVQLRVAHPDMVMLEDAQSKAA